MLFWTVVKVAFKSIRANKLRSFLTVMGVVIGVGSVIAMLGLGAGTQEKILANMRNFGANLLVVRAGLRGGGSGVRTGITQNLRVEDAEAILRGVPEIAMVTPDLDGRFQVKYLNKNVNVTVNGEAVTYFKIRNFPIEKGASFTEADVNRNARVAVLGPKTAEDLFGDMNPVGETIKIRGINFVVSGVTKSKDENSDENIWIPYTTAMNQVIGQTHLDQIYCKVKDNMDMAAVQAKVEEVMRRQHRIQAGAPDDFTVRNYQESIDTLQDVAKMFTLLLAGVAAISLLVGGVNIMNIMLVTVTERTREIGIRKALGARNLDVLSQFLLEALTLSMTGGFLGVVFGVGAVALFNHMTERMTGEAYGAKIMLLPIIISFSFSAFVGVFFGWYPARKAARLDPIEALRYE